MTDRVADVIAEGLARAGCRVAFGIPGGEVLTLIDALARRGIEFVLARQETAAAHMAQGVARATGAPGLLVTTVGPGVAMAVDGIASAHQDRVPLIALTGCVDDEDVALGFTHQVFDQQAVLRPVTKGQRRVRAGEAAHATDWAVSLALAPRPGPVQLELAPRVAEMTEEAAPRVVLPEPSSDRQTAADVEAMVGALRSASRPLVIVGLDALDRDAQEPLGALTSALGAPVLTTYLAKGVVSEESPLTLGAFGLSPAVDRALLPLVRAADVVLLVGYDPIEVRASWTMPFAPDALLLEIARVPGDPRLGPRRLSAIGRLGPLLARLAEGVASFGGHPRLRESSWLQTAEDGLARAHARMDASPPGKLVSALQAASPKGARVVVDTGAHRILLSQRWRSEAPGALWQSTGLCTMACAVPLAVGLLVARRDIPTIAVTGDGGLEMVLGELATVRDLGVPLPIVVFDDQALELIALKQRSMRHASVGVNSGGTDFAAVARALGGHGARVERPEDLGPLLGEALARPAFTVLQCPIPRGSYDGVI